MKPKFKPKSPVDSVIIDMIIEHYNIQNLSGRKENLSGDEFDAICKDAEKIYYETILITKEPGVA
tara:strand:+ start:114 stop:308 length:195 start_codon:yes stop_codon:yes gene_type:complete